MLKEIASLLDRLTGARSEETLGADDLRVATAALLIHAMAVDGEVTEAESGQLRALLAAHFNLTDKELNPLLIQAERQEREAVDIYRFTSVLRDRLPLEQKRDLIAIMWRLVYADGKLEPMEDNLIWRTAELLAVPARDRMQLKQMVRAEMGIE